ncbi:MAG: hypothetical protein AN488_20575 [Anabaena sp. WA113]|jgi:hypothetical protein|nr:MAG: hypothetical protein AN488_20575 [Anabaena sp. WA113]
MKPLPQATLKPQGKVIEKERSHSGIFLVELLWKFLKMHLKLDRLITKNVNGIAEVLNVKKSLIKIAQNMLNFGRRIKIF